MNWWEKQYEEVEVIAELVKNLVKKCFNTSVGYGYIKKYNILSKWYEEVYRKIKNLQKDRELKKSKDRAIELFIWTLKN